MYILISATIILWLAVVTIIYKLNKMNSLLLDCQRDVVDLLYKTRAIDDWIDKQAEQKLIDDSNAYDISNKVDRNKLEDLKKYVYKLEDRMNKRISKNYVYELENKTEERLNELEKLINGLTIMYRELRSEDETI